MANLVLGQDGRNSALSRPSRKHVSTCPLVLWIFGSLELFVVLPAPPQTTPAFTEPSPAFPGPASTYVDGPNLDHHERGTQFHLRAVNWFTTYPPKMPAATSSSGLSPARQMTRAERQRQGRARNKKSTKSDTTKTADAEKADDEPPITSIPSVNNKYDPDLLPDHRGPYFNHQVSKLVQRDHIDADEKFIAPHELYGQLTKGTLFCARISFKTFIFKEGKYPSKVLHKGYSSAWFPPIPSLSSPSGPSTPTKLHREPESDHNDVDEAFNYFSLKKNKTK
ncbi:hypothetical protein B0H17DRAFT_1140361 [Mycena rosella]|uniref:Uncharacterized protein n=1 Tax=Mycena rosella TaxID=1033263 RepID=A0AAD7D3L3_MYCRO|nr:hypothetical protein B0H17DRAFT_1140361 [Mycena rosella]